eukprot:gb/GECH01010142.1/.p1 GENE.gb/GECH01010142.1/~~gb/GECH01010142.1/.p1  ORF type:complete len:443 (+),score=105.66 gb/GECH01010142.1/:1-1329(+)
MMKTKEIEKQRHHKAIFVLIDGLGDVGVKRFHYKTPLQYVKTQNMDLLSRYGLNGLLDPVETGLACGSDTAHMSIFGYEPRIHYRGRGAFETMGAGLDMVPGDIAFKSNFATWDPNTNIVLSRRADRNFEDIGPILCNALNGIKIKGYEDYEVAVKYSTEHRCGIRLRGPHLSNNITGTDPLRDNLELLTCRSKDPDDKDAVHTSKIVNALSSTIHQTLSNHPINEKRKKNGKPIANIVLLRGCGVCLDVPSFEETHGLKPFMIAPTAIIGGLGKTLKMNLLKVPEATGDYYTNLDAKAEACAKQITHHDLGYNFGFLHVKAVDDAGHDGNLDLKSAFLEKIDNMIGKLLTRLQDDAEQTETDYTIVVTGDHSTPCYYKDHSHEPVPFLICKLDALNQTSKNVRNDLTDSVASFNEIDAANGSLGRFPGSQVMLILKEFMKA